VPSSKGAGNSFFKLNLLKNDERASNCHADLCEIPSKAKTTPCHLQAEKIMPQIQLSMTGYS
jgi:hypothetical protein